MPAIEVEGLRKTYGSVEAVRDVAFSVDEGEVFALLGPNGAGKTTTVEILEGYRSRDAGRVSVLGFDPGRAERRLKEQIGIVLQSTGVELYLTVAETIDMFRGFYPRPRPRDEVLDVVGLTPQRDTRVGKLSGGQQRRLDVGVALAGDPTLLFLDEPTTGFDPGARRNAWGMIKTLASLGKTVFLTTHYMDEAQYLADRVAIIAGGEILVEGAPATLTGRETPTTTIHFRLPAGRALPDWARVEARVADGIVEMKTTDPTRVLHDLTGWALKEQADLEDLRVTRPSLEDVYLEITGATEGQDSE